MRSSAWFRRARYRSTDKTGHAPVGPNDGRLTLAPTTGVFISRASYLEKGSIARSIRRPQIVVHALLWRFVPPAKDCSIRPWLSGILARRRVGAKHKFTAVAAPRRGALE